MSFDDVLFNKKNVDVSTIDVMKIKIHIIDDFDVNLLLNNDVIYFQNIKLNSKKKHRFIIDKCENFRVLLIVQNRIIFHVKRIVCSRKIYILIFDDLIEMLIFYNNSLSNDKNFLFEFQCQYDLNYAKNVYVYVLDNNFVIILIHNAISELIVLTKRAKFNNVTK